ncbi:MAG: anthranilate synthase component I family protein, partial [Bacillota bacterium]
RPLYLVGASPEVMVKLHEGRALLRPIAGTRPRGRTPDEDRRLEAELLDDPKENAEHMMLVDLGRNDLGRVCQYGTVRVTRLVEVERYSHVMHLVSEVEGTLRDGLDAFDLVRAAFPAGTVTGAPKIRAMQIIDELEASGRGPYAGAVGYFSVTGSADSCITIRTLAIRAGVAHARAGAGIVADSTPRRELLETESKAQALFAALSRFDA